MLSRSAARPHTATSHALFFLLSYLTIHIYRDFYTYVAISHTLVFSARRAARKYRKSKGKKIEWRRRRRTRRSAVSTVKRINNSRPTSIAVQRHRASRLRWRRKTRYLMLCQSAIPTFQRSSHPLDENRPRFVPLFFPSSPSSPPPRRLMDTSE